MKELASHVYVETGSALVTVGAILTSDGWMCIDTLPYPRDAQAWRSALQRISGQPFRYIINTDHHRDRVLGNAWFDAPVVAHQVTAQQLLATKGSFISQAAEELSRNDNELVEIASLRFVPPQISFSDTLELHCGERVLTLYHRPGAAIGNTWVLLPDEKILFAGDSVTANQHPVITDGSTRAWLESLDELQQSDYEGWTIVPGRGEPATPEAARALADYLRAARRRISSLCKSGRPRSEMGGLVQEFLPLFPFETDQREEVQRRIRTGLEVIYEEIRTSGEFADAG